MVWHRDPEFSDAGHAEEAQSGPLERALVNGLPLAAFCVLMGVAMAAELALNRLLFPEWAQYEPPASTPMLVFLLILTVAGVVGAIAMQTVIVFMRRRCPVTVAALGRKTVETWGFRFLEWVFTSLVYWISSMIAMLLVTMVVKGVTFAESIVRNGQMGWVLLVATGFISFLLTVSAADGKSCYSIKKKRLDT